MELTPEQIIELGKKVGNGINGVSASEIFDPKNQQAIHDMASLALIEILDPIDSRIVPEEI